MEFTETVAHPVTCLVISGNLIDGEIAVCRIIIGTGAELLMRTKKQCTVHHRSINLMVRQFIDYLDGTSVGPSEVNIDYGKITGFQAAVLSAARRVPYGSTCTYSELALMAGFPKAIRAVASVMRNNRVPLLVPCHRIVKKDGSTGAYCGDRNGADALLKKTLLQLERGQLKKCRCLSSFSCS